MGLDWCIQTAEDSEKSKCELVGGKKLGDDYTQEQYLEKISDPKLTYKEDYIEAIKNNTPFGKKYIPSEDGEGEGEWVEETEGAWDKEKKKWNCETCPGETEKVCQNCPEGSFACGMFGMGGCNFRGKVTKYAFEALGLDDSCEACYHSKVTHMTKWE